MSRSARRYSFAGLPAPGSAPSTDARIEGVEQPVAFEPVQVELCLVGREVEGIRRHFSADGVRLCAHEQVQAAPKRIGQCADACDMAVGEGHAGSLSNRQKA